MRTTMVDGFIATPSSENLYNSLAASILIHLLAICIHDLINTAYIKQLAYHARGMMSRKLYNSFQLMHP